mgnify:FL=1
MEQVKSIPKEKFQFTSKNDTFHDAKPKTKPIGYFRDAFNRFCKNKGSVVGAVIILALILFAIIAPFCTPYSVSYKDTYFRETLPKSTLFANTNFWDGCSVKEAGKARFKYLYAMGEETGHNAVKNQKYELLDSGMYKFREDSYYSAGCIYRNFTMEEYARLTAYQDETGIQVIYPTVRVADRPKASQDAEDANYYFKTEGTTRTRIVYDENDNVIPVYWTYKAGEDDSYPYNSLRIEGENGFEKDGETYFYAYARPVPTGVQCRINYYEYYVYNHRNDGIKKPLFLFGTTGDGQDILTCLASGARFSFIFAIAVAIVNMAVGAIYGAVEGYYGGKIDLVMERVSDILSAVPMMIIITLLKLHMGASSQILVLFLAFFLTGWIGMAGSTRMQFYRFKNREYVLAARTLGASDARLMFKHIFPNALGTLVTGSALVIPSMIYSETNLSYLGIINLSSGNITSVGTLIAGGQALMETSPHIALFPSIFLALLMLSFNLFGNGLRDAFNPSLRGTEG